MSDEDNLNFRLEQAESVQLDGLTLTVGRLVNAPASEIFSVLADPSQHPELDPKGLNQRVDPGSPERITAVGQEFTLDMYAESQGGAYRMVNHITKFEEDTLIAWKPQSEPRTEPLGQQWTWELEAEDDDATYVTLVYDWEDVTDEKFLAENRFPLFPLESFKESVEALAELVEDDDAWDWDEE